MDLFRGTMDPVEKVLRDSKMSKAQVHDVVHQLQRVDGVEDRARRRVHRVAPGFDVHVRREEGRFRTFQPFGHLGVVGGRRAVELVQGLLDDGQGLQRGEQGQEAQWLHFIAMLAAAS